MSHWYRSKRFFVIAVVVTVVAALLPLVVFSSSFGADPVPVSSGIAGAIPVQPSKASMAAGQRITPSISDKPIALSAEKEAEMRKAQERTHLSGPIPPTDPQQVVGPQGGVSTIAPQAASAGGPPSATGAFSIFRTSIVAPAGTRSNIAEASVAQSGRFIFYTYNWGANYSLDGGNSWGYINPYADMSDFCCDQEVVYDEGRDIFLWLRMGVPGTFGGIQRNRYRLTVWQPGQPQWCAYDFWSNATNVSGRWYDYPNVALSNDYIWVSTNVFNFSNAWTSTQMLKWPLDSLAACAGFGWSYLNWGSDFNFTPVQGAHEVMWFASNWPVGRAFNSSMRIFWWFEDAGIYYTDRAMQAWTPTYRGQAVCLTADGRNPCARLDHRINTGWATLRERDFTEVGWMWTVRAGGGFNNVYVNAGAFRSFDLAYWRRPYWYYNGINTYYASAAPNKRGALGVATWGHYTAGTNIRYPSLILGIDDDANGWPPGWEAYWAYIGNDSPASNVWGDYLRVRAFEPTEKAWVVSAHVQVGGESGTYTRLIYQVFGRYSDRQSVWRWWGV